MGDVEPETVLKNTSIMLSYLHIISRWQSQHVRWPRLLGSREERWAQVWDYEGEYEVSNWGKVRSIPRLIRCSEGLRGVRERILKPWEASNGYLQITLYSEGKPRLFRVHQLVWEAFNGPVPDGLEINHKDTDKLNCKLRNLELVTHQENLQHAAKNGLYTHVLTKSIVREIRQRYAAGGVTLKELAEEFGVTRQTIGYAVRGETWSHVS